MLYHSLATREGEFAMKKLLIFWALIFAFGLRIECQAKGDAPGARFNTCLAGLSNNAKDHRGMLLLLDDVRRIPGYRESKWNVNKPYDPGAINLMMPMPLSPSEKWPAECGTDPDPADCL